MTNAEKYKTPEEQTKAFRAHCKGKSCKTCPLYNATLDIHCAFTWLNLEAQMSATEAAYILEIYNKDVGDNGIMFRTLALNKAIDRAVELLRGLEKQTITTITNQEKYKTYEERVKAFEEFCCHRCVDCQLKNRSCILAWLELEAQLSASEVADILEKYEDVSDKSDNKGVIHTSPELYKAIVRAVEILRGLGE